MSICNCGMCVAARAVECPKCWAQPGQECDWPFICQHPEREHAAARAIPAPPATGGE